MTAKGLACEVSELDPSRGRIRVRFTKWWEPDAGAQATATFTLDPFAIVRTAQREAIRIAQLKRGQFVQLTYIRDQGGRPIATTVAVAGST